MNGTGLVHGFWYEKCFDDLSEQEWEALCDGCGLCCLHKLEDEDTGEILFTDVACRLLDIQACRCTRYAQRHELVPECLNLRQGFGQWHWLPASCAYRLLAEGKDLPAWHPLLAGDAALLHGLGKTVRAFAVLETDVECLEEHVIEWPLDSLAGQVENGRYG
jgi:uncharacterized cysteine cluster protein YcgN (CxxCxxCC family)